jgi:hypothetical protein
MKFVNVLSFSFLVFLFIASCDTSEPPVQSTLVLKLEEVSCTEAWLQLTSTNIQLPNNISVLINGSVKKTFTLNSEDSLLYIDSLLPNQTYKIIATMQQGNNASNELSVTTLDTTSHNFNWQTFEFGQHSSSILYDVAIIDENNIWAVGEIYMNDSLGNPDTKIYNALRWNGLNWELKRIPILLNGTPFYPIIKSIFAFNENDIWFEAGIHWDGITFKQIPFNIQWNGNVNKIWGSSSNDLYAVGNNGNIAYYNGSNWTKIESGTTTNINDVWGVVDQSNNQEMVYSAVSFVAQNGDQKILKIQNNKVDSLNWDTGRRVHSVWTLNNRFLYATGGGIFENRRGYWNEITEVPLYYSRNIRGTDNNNIFSCGDFGFFAHFNGTSWKTYNELYIQGIYYSISAKNNIVITVGFNGSKAIIIKGERN